MGNTADKFSGKAKQAAGKISGDKKLQAEGKLQEAKAELRKKFGNSFNEFK